jgi:hypothetical protein
VVRGWTPLRGASAFGLPGRPAGNSKINVIVTDKEMRVEDFFLTRLSRTLHFGFLYNFHIAKLSGKNGPTTQPHHLGSETSLIFSYFCWKSQSLVVSPGGHLEMR